MNRISWKEIILGTIAGLSLLNSPAVGQVGSTTEESAMRMDNRGPGALNSGHGSFNSGPGSVNSGRDDEQGQNRGRRGRHDVYVTQAGDIRQEDRRADRQMDRREDRREDRRIDRREDRREDRQLNRREDRREDRQMDRREDRREDRQSDRREDHRSNAGGELRGLDRADYVAGEHGREGRDHARFMQNDRQHGREWIERNQRPERLERTDRSDHAERSGRH